MAMKPGYKQTEVGIIPDEWDSMACANLCVKIQDGTHFSPTIRGHDFLYLTSKNIRFGFLDISTAGRIDAAQHESIYRRCDVKYGDLLLTKDGVNTGNAALNTLTEQFSLLSSVAFLRFDAKKHSAPYFLQQCLSTQGQQRMKDAMSGNAITRLTLEKIRKLCFPVAPLPEQRAIATALSDVDALLGGLDRGIAKKRDLKRAAMQQLLTGQKRLPGFHGKWEAATLGNIGTFKNGLNKDSSAFGHGSPFVNLMDVFGVNAISSTSHLGLVASTKLDQEVYDLRQGDVLFIRSSVKPSGVGLTAVVECDLTGTVYSGFLIRFRDDGVLDGGFKRHCFYAEGFRKRIIAASSVSANTNINQNALRALTLLLPPTKEEQTAIAEVLTDIDAELVALEQRREKTRGLKQAMMQELLTGRTRLISPKEANA